MSARSASVRREAAAEAIAKQREHFAEKRAARAASVTQIERRQAERRTGPFDRREGERRFATVPDKLAAVEHREKTRRFTGDPITGFGGDDV